ncbi:uncharacterized protein LOC126842245 [Adelges cooleyi]|uniref:uncharacterized protein LOC126842245 n=1 Tax=Adelges cooleyi TaxID=133065 RepID=UPI00217F8A85|nr:uncharacterized protein LOC126842245 [Adelges cooleyi]
MERNLQLVMAEGSGLTKVRAEALASGAKSINALGAERRAMLIPVLSSLLGPSNHISDFTHKCLILELFWSTTNPTSYTTLAYVTHGDMCVIRHGTRVVNITQMVLGQSLV